MGQPSAIAEAENPLSRGSNHDAQRPSQGAGGKAARLPASERRAALIAATLDVIAEDGLQAATLRRVAERAGVSNGLIRHHFSGKRPMILAAYEAMIERMTAPGKAVLEQPGLPPVPRLAAFIRASLDPLVTEPRLFSIWAGFVALIHGDAEFEAIHRAGYLDYQTRFDPLVRAVLMDSGRDAETDHAPRLAVMINALIDGLWIEGCLLERDFAEGELISLALDGVGRILKLDLREYADAFRHHHRSPAGAGGRQMGRAFPRPSTDGSGSRHHRTDHRRT